MVEVYFGLVVVEVLFHSFLVAVEADLDDECSLEQTYVKRVCSHKLIASTATLHSPSSIKSTEGLHKIIFKLNSMTLS